MSTIPVTNTLMSLFVPIGWAGAVIAIACALVVAFAVARGAAGLTGGAIGVWFIGALMSVAASFASLWTPLLIAGIALTGALVLGGMVRMLTLPRPVSARPVVEVPDVVPAPATPVQPAMVQTVAPRTQTVKTAGSPVTA